MTDYVQLNRKFSPISSKQNLDVSNLDYSLNIAYGEKNSWEDLLKEYRCVILAEAGAGKTKEFEECAKRIQADGKYAFFIRIEDIDKDFVDEFEIGDEDQFNEWLTSTDPAWFFLDSVDEARLANPKQFHKAIKKFARSIKTATHRCHIYISSRPYSWGFESDEKVLDTELFYGVKDEQYKSGQDEQLKSALKVFDLSPLTIEDIERFCEIRAIVDIPNLLIQIERYDLLKFAERPFDLESIINKWRQEGALGSRSEIIKYNIQQRLTDRHDPNRGHSSVSSEKLYAGAQRLAAVVMLTRKASINVFSSTHNTKNIDPIEVLPEWTNEEILALLNCAIFNDIVYDAVRFRHRDIREFLAAQWFSKLLNGDDRLSTERLFFREQFDENIVVPSLRPILPWLILLDEKICQDVMKLQPEIAFESGDPAQLTVNIRKQFFSKFVERIANNKDDRAIRDNDSIAKIADFELENEVLSLIQTYYQNDEVIFFLGRLVWQGKFSKCLSLLRSIALDSTRNMYSRRVSTRAIIACGTREEKIDIWTTLNQNGEKLDRQLIVELIDKIDPDQEFIGLLIESLKNAALYKRFERSGLTELLEKFTNKLDAKLGYQLLVGIADLLSSEPFLEIRQYQISKQHAWTLTIAFQIIEKLIEERNSLVLEDTIIEILINSTALKYERDYDVFSEKNRLGEIIPKWDELNDKLYWYSIEKERLNLCQENQKELNDDWAISYLGHFWDFNVDNIDRLLNYIDTKDSVDDKLVCLNRAFLIYSQQNKTSEILKKIQEACTNYSSLLSHLTSLLTPVRSDLQQQREVEQVKRKSQHERKQLRENIAKLEWIQRLKNNPEQLKDSPHILNSELTNNHIWLMDELESHELSINRFGKPNWKELIPDFGQEVAEAYRDSAIQFWRKYVPKLHSEEILEKNITPGSLIFGLTGLEIEFKEDPEFCRKLNLSEIENALRYTSWEINGFPSWLEKFHQYFPNQVLEAVSKEVIWELNSSNPEADQHYNHILQDIFYHAPWLHAHIAQKIFEWFRENSKLIHKNTNEYAVKILLNSDLRESDFSQLAQQKIHELSSSEHKAWWYSLYVDNTPEEAISALTVWLESLSDEDALLASQVFICNLIGKRDSITRKAGRNKFKEIKYLKQLYSLMHKYIKIDDDISRANTGVYSPELRDDAQDARDLLFTYLKEVPCAESYYAIKDLIREHMNEDRRIWLEKTAHYIALSCGDIEPWDNEQVLQFEASGNIKPKTHKELYDLALLRIIELREWLENGDDSPWLTWQRVVQETEMRNLIASELRKNARGKYSITQENELANSQRTDIRFDNSTVNSAVPVELKLLDKSWSGADLCERLRNQLVGDYLRERTAGCGIFLLVSQSTNKNWIIEGNTISLSELEKTLQEYWYSIASEWPKIDAIKVIVIDLSKRGLVSNA
ncbi:NACHT domain-containing protein [Acinetobacter oleivorans]|uniref:NACHT domain-containing protein n=1 Tax=Acinetobacter oleivorans TaxID=1148157 RepID=UPI003A85B674